MHAAANCQSAWTADPKIVTEPEQMEKKYPVHSAARYPAQMAAKMAMKVVEAEAEVAEAVQRVQREGHQIRAAKYSLAYPGSMQEL